MQSHALRTACVGGAFAGVLFASGCLEQAPAPSECPAVAGAAVAGTAAVPGAGADAGGSASAATGGSTGAAASGSETASGGAPITGMPDTSACNMRSLDECAAGSGCQVLSGRRVTTEPACLQPLSPVGCGSSQGCAVVPVRATDAMGSDWVFESSCLPAGFVDATSTGTRFDDCAPAP